MKITQSFTVARPITAVWGFFQDVPSVAACLPGTELIESRHDGVQRGKVAASLGPFKATFEGEATMTSNPVTRAGHVEGRGVDKRGGSHSRMSLDYRLAEQPGGTRIDIDVDLTLSGPIGQFGRTGLINEAAKVLIGDFARNLEDRMSAAPTPIPENVAPRANRVNVLTVLSETMWRKIKIFFSRPN